MSLSSSSHLKWQEGDNNIQRDSTPREDCAVREMHTDKGGRNDFRPGEKKYRDLKKGYFAKVETNKNMKKQLELGIALFTTKSNSKLQLFLHEWHV